MTIKKGKKKKNPPATTIHRLFYSKSDRQMDLSAGEDSGSDVSLVYASNLASVESSGYAVDVSLRFLAHARRHGVGSVADVHRVSSRLLGLPVASLRLGGEYSAVLEQGVVAALHLGGRLEDAVAWTAALSKLHGGKSLRVARLEGMLRELRRPTEAEQRYRAILEEANAGSIPYMLATKRLVALKRGGAPDAAHDAAAKAILTSYVEDVPGDAESVRSKRGRKRRRMWRISNGAAVRPPSLLWAPLGRRRGDLSQRGRGAVWEFIFSGRVDAALGARCIEACRA